MTSEAMLRTWFKKSIQPSNTMLWVSAVAPNTFQGDPQILRQLLNRPLELPDAMGQQRACARFCACLIARAINEMNPTPQQLISLLHEFNFFQNPDMLLQKPLPDTLQTHVKKLIREAFDPTDFWKYELQTLTKHLSEGLHVLRTLFKIRGHQKQAPKLTSFFVTEHEWWGTNYHREANSVNVHPPFLFLPAVGKSLVLRDAVRIFLPTSFQGALDVQEFANILITELLNPSERHLWSLIKWNGTPPTPEQQKWVSKITAITPILIEKKCLPSLYMHLKRIDALVTRVPTGSFTITTQQELIDTRPQPTITKTQQTVILTLAKNPMASERQLAKRAQLARGTINRNLATLQDQYGMSVPGELNYQKIGLTPLLLEVYSRLGKKNEVSKLFNFCQQLRTFPYCFRLQAPLSPTNTIAYAVLALPDKSITKFQQSLEEWMNNTGLSTQLFRITKFQWGLDFTYWEQFLPIEWKILASSDFGPESSESSVTYSIEYEKSLIRLTREALRVLLILQKDMRLSQRQLANKAHTAVSTARKHHRRFIPDVITPHVVFAKPALSEGLITLVNCSSLESCTKMLRGMQLLPISQVWYLAPPLNEEPSTLLISVNLPKGSLMQFHETFQEVTSFYDAILSLPLIASNQLPQIHELPLALFKTVEQEWMCSPSLFESIFKPPT